MRKYKSCIAVLVVLVCALGAWKPTQASPSPAYMLGFVEENLPMLLGLDRNAENLVDLVDDLSGTVVYSNKTEEEKRQCIIELLDVLENTEFIMLCDRLPDSLDYYAEGGTVTAGWEYGDENYSTCTIYLPSAPQYLLMKNGEYLTREPQSLGNDLNLYAVKENSRENNNGTEYYWIGYLKYKDYYIKCEHSCIVGRATSLDAESMVQTIRNAPKATIAEYAEDWNSITTWVPYICVGLVVAGVLVAVVIVVWRSRTKQMQEPSISNEEQANR